MNKTVYKGVDLDFIKKRRIREGNTHKKDGFPPFKMGFKKRRKYTFFQNQLIFIKKEG